MSKASLNLQESEAVVVQTAGIIYAAFIQSGKSASQSDDDLVEKSVQIAIDIAKLTDEKVRSDQELG